MNSLLVYNEKQCRIPLRKFGTASLLGGVLTELLLSGKHFVRQELRLIPFAGFSPLVTLKNEQVVGWTFGEGYINMDIKGF